MSAILGSYTNEQIKEEIEYRHNTYSWEPTKVWSIFIITPKHPEKTTVDNFMSKADAMKKFNKWYEDDKNDPWNTSVRMFGNTRYSYVRDGEKRIIMIKESFIWDKAD